MSGIFGLLGIEDTDRSFVNTKGQKVVYDAVAQLLEDHNANLQAMQTVFVSGETEDFKFRYKLPGGGYLQRRSGQANSGAVKPTGSWDVAFPIDEFGADLAGDDIGLAYMNMQELNTHLDTIFMQDINTVRMEIMRALLDNVSWTYSDRIHGDLTIVPLANGDTTVYPPVLGSSTEATEDHYLKSGYLTAAISDANNPIKTIVEEIVHHFADPAGGSNIIVFIHPDQTAKIEALTDFTEVEDMYIRPGTDQATIPTLPTNVPGKIIGRCSGAWISEWRWMPAAYMFGLHLDQPKPLKVRVDPADTGLPRGLTLVAKETETPLENSHYRHRFGVGGENRLNGVAMFITDGGAYVVPTGYSH
jgi:hypothetical protein